MPPKLSYYALSVFFILCSPLPHVSVRCTYSWSFLLFYISNCFYSPFVISVSLFRLYLNFLFLSFTLAYLVTTSLYFFTSRLHSSQLHLMPFSFTLFLFNIFLSWYCVMFLFSILSAAAPLFGRHRLSHAVPNV